MRLVRVDRAGLENWLRGDFPRPGQYAVAAPSVAASRLRPWLRRGLPYASRNCRPVSAHRSVGRNNFEYERAFRVAARDLFAVIEDVRRARGLAS